jgi:hypothetical protein
VGSIPLATDSESPQQLPPAGPVDLLRLIHAALDLPPAAFTDERARTEVLSERALHVVVALDALVYEPAAVDWRWSLNYLAERLAEHPATYRVAVTSSALVPAAEGGTDG